MQQGSKLNKQIVGQEKKMVVSTSTDQPQTLSFHQKFSAKTNRETQSPKSYKTIFKLSETHLNKNTPKKHTHTHKNRNKTALEKNNQQGVCIHRCLIVHSNQQQPPDCIPLLFPGPLLFSVLSSSPFSLPETDPPYLTPRSQITTSHTKQKEIPDTLNRRR
jgi:hypothetical protein